MAKKTIINLIASLRAHNAWRRGDTDEQPHPKKIGNDIDQACDELARLAMIAYDDDGQPVTVGNFINSTYGIPPVRIRGELVIKNKQLWVLTPGHSPAECSLAKFKKCLGPFWKE